MEFKLTEIKRVRFEDTLKTYLFQQVLLPEREQDSYFRLTRCARRELEIRVAGFSLATKQLILRCAWTDLISMVMRLKDLEDAVYMAEIGTKLDTLYYTSDENIKAVTHLLLKRQLTLPSGILDMIVKNYDDLYDLYLKARDGHQELLPTIIESDKCSPDLFVEIVNRRITDDKILLNYRTLSRLEALLKEKKISILRTPNLKKEESNATNVSEGKSVL